MHTPDLSPRIVALYAQAAPAERARLLNRLLRQVGPLALVTIAAGAFGGLLPTQPEARWREAEVTLDDTRWVGRAEVQALADYVAQKAPELLLALSTQADRPDSHRPLPG